MTKGGPELSHMVHLDHLGAAPVTVTMQPASAVRAALAARFDLQVVDSFDARFVVRRRSESGWIEVSGSVVAAVVQTCVVSGDPVPATVTTEVLELFDDSGDPAPEELDLDPMADSPEPIAGGTLDVGEIAAQAFGLALDPYPRVAGLPPLDAVFDEADPSAGSPFAKLAALKAGDVKKE